LLSEFSAWILRTKKKSDGFMTGGIILAVVGGKLSEGINFSDDLGRCVIMVGMPYPNKKSVELQEKMNYLDATIGNGEGRRYYENLCMKAVNQSIGRAIRHKNDYALIVLLDQRYSRQSVISALPKWIGNETKIPNSFGEFMNEAKQFFAEKRGD